jgi:phage terminase small subunit
MPRHDGSLTEKQKLFCKEYIKDLNASRAAIAAGYSKKTATVTASENLTKPNINKFINELRKDREERVQIDADWVLRQAVHVHDKCLKSNENNPALKALDIVGKHVSVRAFDLDNGTFKLTPQQLAQLDDKEIEALKIAQGVVERFTDK